MSTYKIRNDIKIPNFGSRTKYPFSMMKVGDSFAVDPKELNRVRASACNYGTRHGTMKFAVRRVDPINETYRCWRIA